MGKKRCPGDKELIRILLRLPVVSLLRFKSVSKSWCALIQTFSFIDLHVNSSSSSNNQFGSFILQTAVDCERFRENALLMLSSPVSEYEYGSFGFNSICRPCVTDYKIGSGACWWTLTNNDDDDDDDEQQQQQLVLKLDNLGFPSCYNFGKNKPHMVMVVGSCNGLICLHDSERGDVSLWNPATRQFRILPKPIPTTTTTTFDGLHNNHCLFAFGFDDKTKDYNVVLLSGLRLRPRRIIDDDDGLLSVAAPMECICRVQVYSLNTDSWRLLEGINVLPGSPTGGDSPGLLLYMNGRCFFMAKFLYSEQCIPPLLKEDNDRFIISLDLTKEIITPIQLPYHCVSSKELYLCYLDHKLALFTTTNRYRGTVCWELLDILVLNEHNKSWTQLHSFGIKHGLPGEWIIPRGISNDGVFVFIETGIHRLDKKKRKMKLYNLVTKEVKKNFIYSDQVLSQAYAYKPSLVSIIGGNNGCSSSCYGIE